MWTDSDNVLIGVYSSLKSMSTRGGTNVKDDYDAATALSLSNSLFPDGAKWVCARWSLLKWTYIPTHLTFWKPKLQKGTHWQKPFLDSALLAHLVQQYEPKPCISFLFFPKQPNANGPWMWNKDVNSINMAKYYWPRTSRANKNCFT